MNCRRFQKLLFEYLDGSLKPRVQTAAESHLASCSRCRQTLRQQQQLGRSLSEHFQRQTERLELGPQVQRRVVAALHAPVTPRLPVVAPFHWWRRLAWARPSAVVLIALALLLAKPWSPSGPPLRRLAQASAPVSQVSIHLAFCAPVYSFRQEGQWVTDSLSCRPCLMDQTLWVSDTRAAGAAEP